MSGDGSAPTGAGTPPTVTARVRAGGEPRSRCSLRSTLHHVGTDARAARSAPAPSAFHRQSSGVYRASVGPADAGSLRRRAVVPPATLGRMSSPAIQGGRLPAVVARSVSKSFTVPEERRHTLKERVLHPRRRIKAQTFKALNDISFAGRAWGVLRHRGAQRQREEHAAEVPGRDLRRRRRHLVPRPAVDVHRARHRFQPGHGRARQRGHERDHDGPLPARGPPPLSSSVIDFAELRGVPGPQAQELLLGDARSAGVLRGDPGGRRHPADRRDPRGR